MEQRKKYPLESSAFTIKEYNDRPRFCLTKNCDGTVYPTVNANVGECDTCHERIPWSRYIKS
ncbi:MAG: hypothetical protein V1802_00400 [Candidatus Aenigmatarchaeota archaeon]